MTDKYELLDSDNKIIFQDKKTGEKLTSTEVLEIILKKIEQLENELKQPHT